MFKCRLTTILLTLTALASGSITMANAQDKPPLLVEPTAQEYGQMSPPPPQPGAVPLVPRGQVLPPPVSPGMAPPPPLGQKIAPLPPPRMQQQKLDNAPIAVATVKEAKMHFSAGKIWSITAPRGEEELKAAVLYDKMAVAILHFNQTDGSLLPLGVRPAVYGVTSSIGEIKRNLPEIVRNLVVLQGAEYREPESSWIVPLAYHGMIVAHIKVYADGIHIVPDYPANQEMQTYGR